MVFGFQTGGCAPLSKIMQAHNRAPFLHPCLQNSFTVSGLLWAIFYKIQVRGRICGIWACEEVSDIAVANFLFGASGGISSGIGEGCRRGGSPCVLVVRMVRCNYTEDCIKRPAHTLFLNRIGSEHYLGVSSHLKNAGKFLSLGPSSEGTVRAQGLDF